MREWLCEIRKARNMTHDAVASASGISRAYYTNVENGKRGDPLPVDTAKKIAETLGFDWTKFFEEEQCDEE